MGCQWLLVADEFRTREEIVERRGWFCNSKPAQNLETGAAHKGLAEVVVPPVPDGAAQGLQKPVKKGQVVKAAQNSREHLVSSVQVAEIGTGEVTARIATAVGLDGDELAGVGLIAHLEQARAREKGSVASVPGRQNAVEEVDPEPDHVDDIGWCSDSHDVTRAIPGQ